MIKQNHNVTAVYICKKVAENCIISNETTVFFQPQNQSVSRLNSR